MNVFLRGYRALGFSVFSLALLASQAANAVDAEVRNLFIESPAAASADGALEGCAQGATGGVTSIGTTVFIPAHNAGEKLPVIITSHGWGGSRSKNPDAEIRINELFGSIDGLIARLWRSGYLILSFDERGWGESGGEIRGIDRSCETQDAIAVLDWAESDPEISKLIAREKSTGDMVLGAVGGSYGGGFQFMLTQEDPRVDVIVPMGTWNSLPYALTPNKVVKRGFASLLCGLGIAATLDPVFYAGCLSALQPTTRTRDQITSPGTGILEPVLGFPLPLNPIGEGSGVANFVHMLERNGIDYFDGEDKYDYDYEEEDAAPYNVADGTAAGGRPPKALPDALFIQGNRDVLFNMNEAVRNYKYYSANTGTDVRFFTNDSGHMNPIANQVNSSTVCGKYDMWEATQAWFDAKLRPLVAGPTQGALSRERSKPRCKGCKVERESRGTVRNKPACRGCKVERGEGIGAGAFVPSITAADIPAVCISLDQREGIALDTLPVRGDTEMEAPFSFDTSTLTPPGVNPVNLGTIPESYSNEELLKFSNKSLPTQEPTFVPLRAPIGEGENLVLAGVPYFTKGSLEVTPITGTEIPIGAAYAYIGVGIKRDGKYLLIDQQVQPFSSREYAPDNENTPELSGIGERLLPEDELGLLIFWEHPQYDFVSAGIPLISQVPFNVKGTINMPLFDASEGTISRYEGEIPPIECNTGDPVGFVYSYSVCLDDGAGALPIPAP